LLIPIKLIGFCGGQYDQKRKFTRQHHKMKPVSPLTCKIVAYNEVPNFRIGECVDWAFEMITLGYETEHLLILAGLTKPVNYFEATSYIDAALKELNLQPKIGNEAIISYCSYYIILIAQGIKVKLNLSILRDACINMDMSPLIFDFYLLAFAWDDLDWNDGQQWHWDGADLDNIEAITIETAKNWLAKNNVPFT
jgi:hypothetical protein